MISIVKQSIIKLVDDCFVSNHMTRSKSQALVRHISFRLHNAAFPILLKKLVF